jgi:hypothetical protein
MKIATKLIALIQIIVLINSSVLAVKDTISHTKIHMKRVHHRSHHRHHRKFSAKDCPPSESQFDIPMFIFGFVMTITGSIEDDVANFLSKLVGPGKKLDQCYETLGNAFKDKIKTEEKKLEEMSNQLMSDSEKEKKLNF